MLSLAGIYIERMIPGKKISCVEKDHSGVDYLHFQIFEEEYEKYLNGQLDRLLTETLLLHAREWVGAMLQAIQKEKISVQVGSALVLDGVKFFL